MSDKIYTITIKVKGKWAAQKITNLLAAIKRLGDWGASRRLVTDWDGDGGEKILEVESALDPNFKEGWTDGEAVWVWSNGIQKTSIKALSR